MEITIKINGRFASVEVSADVADYLEQATGTIGNFTGSVSGIGTDASVTST